MIYYHSPFFLRDLGEYYKRSCQSMKKGDYYFMLHASKLVLSASTLAWWAGWLGSAKEVHFPQIGFWHPESIRTDVDLMVNENRYVYHDLGVKDDWLATDKEIEQLLKY